MAENYSMADCPTCGRLVEWLPSSKWRPFCSERCKLIDLGAWFNEENVIPDESTGLIEEGDHEPQPH